MPGKFWRVITTLFNAWWLDALDHEYARGTELGRLLEIRLGVWRYILLILIVGCLSNVAQYTMSYYGYVPQLAVHFGLFWCVVWILWICLGTLVFLIVTRIFFGTFMINRQVIAYYVIFGLFCLTGMLGNIADTAHFSGLVVGFVWGWWHARQPGNV